MPIQLPVIALLAILAAIIDGYSSQDVTDVPEGKEDETKDELKKKAEKVDEPCVCDACVKCKSATAASRPVHIKKDGGTIEVGDRSKLNEKDITLEEPFEGCTQIGKCIVSESVIENQEWMDTDINRDNGQRSLNCLTSYMICTAGPGIIYFSDAGQNLKSFIDELETDEIELLELAQLIKCFEIGDIYNKNNPNYIKSGDKVIGIRLQNAKDGYLTIRYGHAIQSNQDAQKYGLDKIPGYEMFDFDAKHSIKEIADLIKYCESYYANNNKRNIAQLSLEEAEILMIDDIRAKRQLTYNVIDQQTSYTKNQIDAITSVLYNGNDYTDPESMSYHLINQASKSDTLSILETAVNMGWYGDGLLRRRLMEFNIYYNDDYSFYDDTELEQLKKTTGFTP